MKPPRRPASVALLLATTLAAVLAAGCGEKKKEKPESQVAETVDGQDITLAQINLVLQQQRNLRPEHADAASRQVLERLMSHIGSRF